MGRSCTRQGAYAQALVLLEESHTLFRRLGSKRKMAYTLIHLGALRVVQGLYHRRSPVTGTRWQSPA